VLDLVIRHKHRPERSPLPRETRECHHRESAYEPECESDVIERSWGGLKGPGAGLSGNGSGGDFRNGRRRNDAPGSQLGEWIPRGGALLATENHSFAYKVITAHPYRAS
jgi:hypothetical protein